MLMTNVVAVSAMHSLSLLVLVMLLAMMLLVSRMLVLLWEVHLHVIPLMTRPTIIHHVLPLLVALVVHPERIMRRCL